MDVFSIFPDTVFVNYVVLPVIIACARITDQSIGTLRVIFISKGYKKLAPVLGFFESMIWLLAIGQMMGRMNNAVSYIFYAGGFAIGSYIGLIIEEKLSIGNVVIRIIPKQDTTTLVTYLRAHDYGVTTIDVEGVKGKLKMILSIVKRKEVPDVVKLVNLFNPNAFYTIEEVKAVREATFETSAPSTKSGIRNPFVRKGK